MKCRRFQKEWGTLGFSLEKFKPTTFGGETGDPQVEQESGILGLYRPPSIMASHSAASDYSAVHEYENVTPVKHLTPIVL
ncbi:hypothetical protein PoB_004979300 [Plakobranchus ocellatus]|uniref:Uncharacterized protein n=1 Tax=Plakobranchus ocellatus TaxID=259542 RepID=A0AAV4BUL4_9GAST|nr:hypothetical protein PoB_004979300 [Plakobranchus ocellatus]